jgi:Zn-finger nucleic acid-binding protein
MSSREGVEIDYCPQCRGVWLDRGELDKIIERVGVAFEAPSGRGERDRGGRERYRDDDDDDRREVVHGYGRDDHRRKKRRSFLDDMFDFG